MLADRRLTGRRLRGAVGFVILAFVLNALTGCTVVAGGGVLAALVGISALTSHCYDYLDVTVLDAQGRKTCAATVTASRDNSGEHFELESCYYTPLTDGRWTLRASLPGNNDAQSVVEVEHKDDCTRHVQSVELTLNTPGLPLAPAPANSVALPTPRPNASTGSSAFPQGGAPSSTPPQAPTAPAAAGAGGASNGAAPSAAGASSVGVFPNQTESSP